MKKNKESQKHKKFLIYSFVLGGIAYAYIAFLGSYGTSSLIKVSFIEIIWITMNKGQSKDILEVTTGKSKQLK
jgi:hypothetical protein